MTTQETTPGNTTTESGADESASTSTRQDVFDSAHKIWLAGLGAVATAEQEGQRFFKRLVERGEEYESRGRERFEEVKGRAEDRFERMTDKFGTSVEDQVNRTLERMGVPSRQEIQDLSRKIDALTAKIDTLAAKPARGGSGPASPDPVPGQNR